MTKTRWTKWFKSYYGDVYKTLGFRLTDKNLTDLWNARKKLKRGQTVEDLHLNLVAKKQHQRELRQRRKLKEIPIEVPHWRHEYGDYFFLKDRLEANVLPETKVEIDLPFFTFTGTLSELDVSKIKYAGDEFFQDFGDESGYWRMADIFDVTLKDWVVREGVVYFTNIKVEVVEGYENTFNEFISSSVK